MQPFDREELWAVCSFSAMTDPLFARFGREYQAGEVLFREGEAGELMFVVQTGAVRITKKVAGEDKVLAVLGPGSSSARWPS